MTDKKKGFMAKLKEVVENATKSAAEGFFEDNEMIMNVNDAKTLASAVVMHLSQGGHAVAGKGRLPCGCHGLVIGFNDPAPANNGKKRVMHCEDATEFVNTYRDMRFLIEDEKMPDYAHLYAVASTVTTAMQARIWLNNKHGDKTQEELEAVDKMTAHYVTVGGAGMVTRRGFGNEEGLVVADMDSGIANDVAKAKKKRDLLLSSMADENSPLRKQSDEFLKKHGPWSPASNDLYRDNFADNFPKVIGDAFGLGTVFYDKDGQMLAGIEPAHYDAAKGGLLLGYDDQAETVVPLLAFEFGVDATSVVEEAEAKLVEAGTYTKNMTTKLNVIKGMLKICGKPKMKDQVQFSKAIMEELRSVEGVGKVSEIKEEPKVPSKDGLTLH